MKTLLKKPTILEFAVGLIISIVKSFINRHKSEEPLKVGKYKLVYSVNKENLFREYSIGIYKYKNKKVFIKSWSGLVRDFEYHELVNEYFVSKALYKILKSHEYIRTQKVIGYIEQKKSFSIIYEFIDAKSLSSFSKEKQIRTLSDVLSFFNNYSTEFVNKNDRFFSKRTLRYYIPAITFLSILTILSDLRSFKVVLRGYFDFLRLVKSIKDSNLRLAHRDLSLHNILVKGKYVFLLDCARVVLTYKDYDIAYICFNLRNKKIAKEIARAFNYSVNPFLENYILINQARSFGNPIGFKNIYLQRLYEKYR